MAQTLTALVLPSNPVIRTDSEELVANMSAFENLGRADLWAVIIVGFVHAIASTLDLRANHARLIQNGQSFMAGINNLDANAMSHQMLLVFAATAWGIGWDQDPVSGANPLGISRDVATVLAESKDLRCLPEETLAKILAYLQYFSAAI